MPRGVENPGAADDEASCGASFTKSFGITPPPPGLGLDGRRAGRQQVVENRHPDDEPRANLRLDESIARVGDPRVDLDAAVHRARMHDLLSGRSRSGVTPQRGRVPAEAGDVVGALLHALLLHAEDVDDVGGGDRLDVCRRLAAHGLDPPRKQGGWPDERDMRAEQRQCLDVRARDPRVQDVADDRDVQALDAAEGLLDRVEVEQGLRRVLVLAVARVHDARLGDPRDELWRANVRVAQDDHVRVVGAERDRGVLQRLALVDRRAARLDRHRVRRESLRGELEARRRSRRRLVEDVDDEPAAQRRELLHLPLERALEASRSAEQALDVVAGQVGDRDQMPPGRRVWRAQVVPHHVQVTHGSPLRPG